MTRFAFPRLLATLMLVLAASAAVSDVGANVTSYDRLPLGDWTYDAMIALAADGVLTGTSARLFQGGRLFTREEMAEVLSSAMRRPEILTDAQRALVKHVALELGSELGRVRPDCPVGAQDAPVDADVLLLAYARERVLDDRGGAPGADSTALTYRATGFANLTAETFAMLTFAEKEERFFHDLRTSTSLDKAFIAGNNRGTSWLVGRAYQNWGPSYSGSLILSDNAPAFWQARAARDIDFGKAIGRVKVTQFASVFEDLDQKLYLIGRRYEKPLSDRWQIGLSETAKLNKMPNPLVLAMPLYLYHYLFLHDEDEHMNNMVGADVLYRASGGRRIYAELLIDDMTAPRLLSDDFSRPRKIGYTIGFSLPGPRGDHGSSFRVEYISVDRLTYSASRTDAPELAYLHDTQYIGHAIGPNSEALYLRGERVLSNRLSAVVEYLNQRQKDPGKPERGSREYLSLTTSWDIAPDKSASVRVTPYEITPPGGSSDHGVQYELRASFAL